MSKKIIIKTNKPIWQGTNEPNSVLEISNYGSGAMGITLPEFRLDVKSDINVGEIPPPNLIVGEPVITNKLIHIGYIGSNSPTGLLHITSSSDSTLKTDGNSIIVGSSFKEPFKLNFQKVKSLKELLWLLNEVDLYINSSHKNYDELKSRFL